MSLSTEEILEGIDERLRRLENCWESAMYTLDRIDLALNNGVGREIEIIHFHESFPKWYKGRFGKVIHVFNKEDGIYYRTESYAEMADLPAFIVKILPLMPS